jgi:siroheme synthase-like protein
VIAATSSSRINEAVFQASKIRGILCNAADDPDHCDFFYPAIVRRGQLQIAISTGGSSPALASRLRRELEQQFGSEWGAWVDHLGELRRELLAKKMSPATRKRRLLQIASPNAFRAFLRRQDRPVSR